MVPLDMCKLHKKDNMRKLKELLLDNILGQIEK